MGCDDHPFGVYGRACSETKKIILDFVKENQPITESELFEKLDINMAYLVDGDPSRFLQELIEVEEIFVAANGKLITFDPAEIL